MSWLLVIWVIVNFSLFAILLTYAVRLQRRWKSSSIGLIAAALVLVAATMLLVGIQRIGIHAARVGVLPAESEEFFLIQFQVILSLLGTIAGVYAITRLRQGIRRLAAGERMITTLTSNVSLDVDASNWSLTEREKEVLATIVSGKTSDEAIADSLYISTATAATHVRNILRKTGLSSRIDLMLVGSHAAKSLGSSDDPGPPEPDVPDVR